MEQYDVVSVGGGVAESIAARLAAENGLKSLLVEQAKTPREKPCSGIQFGYFGKLVGRSIPNDKLCSNEISNMYIITPDDKTFVGKMKVLNFWRSTFDRWLNDLAVEEGAIFRDKTRMIDFDQVKDGYQIQLQAETESREIITRYLIAADGMSFKVRNKLQPDDFLNRAPGGAMNDLQKLEQENSVLRWGGLTGLLGAILFVLVWVVVGVFVPLDPADLAGWVTRFPDIQATHVVENAIYLVALLLEVPLFLALYQALRRTSLAPALFGSVLGIVGLTVMVVGTTPHVAHATLSNLYHAPGASPADQATIALLWQATWGIFDAMLYVGFFVVSIGVILLGVAMLGTPAFGKGYGWMSVVLGVLGIVAAVLQLVDPSSMIGAGSYFACLIFYLVLGWKLYSLSRAS